MRKLATIAACLVVLACSTAGPENNLVGVEMVQLQGAEEQNYPFGRFDACQLPDPGSRSRFIED